MGKRSKSKTNKASSKTSIKKKSLECRTFRKLSSTFATSLSVAEEEKQRQQRQQQQRLQGRRSVSTTPISVGKISSQNRPSLVQQKEETNTNSRIPNHEVTELNANYQNLLERDYASTIHKTRSKKELRRCDLALKRKERKLRNMKRTMERPPSSQSQHSSSHSATTATALSCLKLFSFSPATFTVAPKTTTELLSETTFSLQGVALQEGQSPQATDMTFSNDPFSTSSSMSTAFQAQGNSKRDQNCSNPFHALQADIEDDNDNAVQRQSVAAPAMASFAFAPPSFAVPPPPPTGTTEMGDDESIDPDL
jgi:hypothetical protein